MLGRFRRPVALRALAVVVASALLCAAGGRGARKDEEPPRIDHEELERASLGRPLEVRARIKDDSGVFDPALLYRVERGGAFLRLPMKPIDGEPGTFTATVPAEVVSDDVEYFIEAFDAKGNGPARFGDEHVPVLVRVLKTAEVAPREAAPPEEEAAEDPALGLWIGAGVGGAVLLAAAAAGGAAALLWLSREDVPATVDVVVKGPLPVSAGVGP